VPELVFINMPYYPNLFGKVNRKFSGSGPSRLRARQNLNHPDVIKLMILEKIMARVVGENDEGEYGRLLPAGQNPGHLQPLSFKGKMPGAFMQTGTRVGLYPVGLGARQFHRPGLDAASGASGFLTKTHVPPLLVACWTGNPLQ
jgi:hypothetical protein